MSRAAAHWYCDYPACPAMTPNRKERGWAILRSDAAWCPRHVGHGLSRPSTGGRPSPPTPAFYEAQAALYAQQTAWRASKGLGPKPMPPGLARYLSTKESSLW